VTALTVRLTVIVSLCVLSFNLSDCDCLSDCFSLFSVVSNLKALSRNLRRRPACCMVCDFIQSLSIN